MARVVLSFARLDTQLSNWLVEGYDMRVDRAALLLQNMTITNKYIKLAKLYEHEGPASLAQQLRRSKKQMEPPIRCRTASMASSSSASATKAPSRAATTPTVCRSGSARRRT